MAVLLNIEYSMGVKQMEVLNMYYSSGNYEAFARPKKPADVDRKSAYVIGSGLAALTAAFYLVRDGQMKGDVYKRQEHDTVH